jgi:hypothetical protein
MTMIDPDYLIVGGGLLPKRLSTASTFKRGNAG